MTCQPLQASLPQWGSVRPLPRGAERPRSRPSKLDRAAQLSLTKWQGGESTCVPGVFRTPQRNICTGVGPGYRFTVAPPRPVCGALVTPLDRQRPAGRPSTGTPRATLGGYPSGRNHHWCFSFTSKWVPVVLRPVGAEGRASPLSTMLRTPPDHSGAAGFPKAHLHASNNAPLEQKMTVGARFTCSLALRPHGRDGTGFGPWFRLCRWSHHRTRVVATRKTTLLEAVMSSSMVFRQVHVL